MTKRALLQLKKLDKITQNKINTYLTKLSLVSNPRLYGKMLAGEYKGCYRYRVGDYRIITIIKDEVLTIQVIKIGHRKEVYK